MGAWIETDAAKWKASLSLSHPTWVRGLKPFYSTMLCQSIASHPTWVRGLKLISSLVMLSNSLSHPTWVRGLKREEPGIEDAGRGRTLRGCVD